MATSTRSTTSDVAEKLERLAREPYRFGFFSALRFLESVYDDQPRLGQATRPSDEPVRIGQEPSLAFAPATLASFKPGGGSRPARLAGYFLGLFGPHGPMPLHLTEYVREREINFRDPTLRRFADMFHHRMLAFFYRAWADTQPTVSLDRSDSRRFDTYSGAILGVASPELQSRDSIDDDAKRFWAGRFSLSTKPAEGLQALLQSFFELPFALREFVGEWIPLATRDRFQLGGSMEVSSLGVNAILGKSVWGCQHRFQLSCGPVGYDDFKRLLPGGTSLTRLKDLIRNYLGDEFAWDCKVILKGDEIPECKLGQSGQLGWTTWIGDRGSVKDADEVIIDPGYTGRG